MYASYQVKILDDDEGLIDNPADATVPHNSISVSPIDGVKI